jgi:hypothetical protein
MPGSEAGTLYKAFIMKAAEAGDQLGLSFTIAFERFHSGRHLQQELNGFIGTEGFL